MDIGLSKVKTLHLAPEIEKSVELFKANGKTTFVASSSDPLYKNWPEDC